MAHELEIVNGKASMMYAGTAPWHGLGTAVDKELTSEDALKAAGLDWTVRKEPLYLASKVKVDDIPVIGEKAQDIFAMVRDTDNRILGTVGRTYHPIQNQEAFAFLDALVGEGLAMFHTAGSLFGGRRIFAACKLPQDMEIGPDQVGKYLTLASGHDGTMSLHIKWTPIRVVCWNTCSAAFQFYGNRAARDAVTIRHTESFKSRLDQARHMLNLTEFYYQRVEDCFRKLLETPMSDYEFSCFTDTLFEPTQEDDQGRPVVTPFTEQKRARMGVLFHEGIGNTDPEVRQTRWAAYNAVTQLVDHERSYTPSTYGGGKADARMNSIVWGHGASIKKQALELLAD